jgi:hypothetical protein
MLFQESWPLARKGVGAGPNFGRQSSGRRLLKGKTAALGKPTANEICAYLHASAASFLLANPKYTGTPAAISTTPATARESIHECARRGPGTDYKEKCRYASQQFRVIFLKHCFHGSRRTLRHGMNLLNQAKDVCGHDKQISCGSRTRIPVGMLRASRHEDG